MWSLNILNRNEVKSHNFILFSLQFTTFRLCLLVQHFSFTFSYQNWEICMENVCYATWCHWLFFNQFSYGYMLMITKVSIHHNARSLVLLPFSQHFRCSYGTVWLALTFGGVSGESSLFEKMIQMFNQIIANWIRTKNRKTSGFVMSEEKRFLYYSLFAWGIPLLLDLIYIIMDSVDSTPDFLKPNAGQTMCFLNCMYFHAFLV